MPVCGLKNPNYDKNQSREMSNYFIFLRGGGKESQTSKNPDVPHSAYSDSK